MAHVVHSVEVLAAQMIKQVLHAPAHDLERTVVGHAERRAQIPLTRIANLLRAPPHIRLRYPRNPEHQIRVRTQGKPKGTILGRGDSREVA
jgi:hypothetical protein